MTGALPIHRVALRAALSGVGGGGLFLLLVALATLLVLGPGRRETLLWCGVAFPSGAALAALFAAAVELARRVPARARLLLLGALALLGPLVGFLAAVWAYELTQGGPERAYEEVVDLLGELARRPDKSLVAGLAVALPFSAAAAARAGGLPGALDRQPSLGAQLGLLLPTSLVGWGACHVRFDPWNDDRWLLAAGFLLGGPALLLGVVLGERLEAKLLAWHARRRES